MKVTPTALEGVLIVEPQVFSDERGSFCETFSERDFNAALADLRARFGPSAAPENSPRFVQDNQSVSRRGVIRGLHFQQQPHSQAKLVRCAAGRIFDVAVDMRAGSPNFGRGFGVELSAENGRQLFVPQGFAHGFSTLSDEATVIYKVDDFYAPECDGGVVWNDPTLAINWGIGPSQVIVSQKDSALPRLADAYKF